MSVFDPPTVLEILKSCVVGMNAQKKFGAEYKAAVAERFKSSLSKHKETPQLKIQLEWEANVVEYVNCVYRLTTVNGNSKKSGGAPPLPKGMPILGPKFIPPGFIDSQKRGQVNIKPSSLYIRPFNIIHPFYYPDIAFCPQCSSKDITWQGWTGAGSREVHGLHIEEKALGYQLRCSPCKDKYGKDGTDVGATNANGDKLGSTFATTNSIFWDQWEHWKIPRGIPYFLYRSALTRELFDFIVELRPSTTSGRLADNVKQFHLLEYKQRHLEYLNAFKRCPVPVMGPPCVLESFSIPDDPDGYNDKSITDDQITDIFLQFSNRTRLEECSRYLRTLSAICMNLDNTYKAANKATVIDSSKVRTKAMKGGILSVLNEMNEIISWRFCQSGSATEIVELIEGFKRRVELLGVKLPEMVTVDNCCTVGNKIRSVVPDIKVLLDVYHFMMRYNSYAVGILGGVHNPRRNVVLKDIKEAVLKVSAGKGTLAQYWSQADQETRLAAAYEKWAEYGGIWSAAAQNIHNAQMQHVRKGCLARPREDISSDGSRIEGSHKGWNGIQRSFASGLEMQTALGHDFVLRRNLRVATNGKGKSPTPFVESTFGSHHISLVDHTAGIWNDLLPGSQATSKSSPLPLPRLPDIQSGETFGLVNSPHTDSFGGLFTIKQEPDDDGTDIIKELDPEAQDDLMRELNIDPAQLNIDPAQIVPSTHRSIPAPVQTHVVPVSATGSPILDADMNTADGVSTTVEVPRGIKRKTSPDAIYPVTSVRHTESKKVRLEHPEISKSPDPLDEASIVNVAPTVSKNVEVERPLYPIFGATPGLSVAPKTFPSPSPAAVPADVSLEELTAPLPKPKTPDGFPKLTRSQQFFNASTGTDPRSLKIHQGQEIYLFMDMRREFNWRSYEMTSRTWVASTAEYNTRLRRLSGGAQFIQKNPRALLEMLGDIEPKIVDRILTNNFKSATGKTDFWTLHCHAVSFIKIEGRDAESTAGSSKEAAKAPRKPQTCKRCRTIKYPGPTGSAENHKLQYCSDGFKPATKDDYLPIWPLPAGIFTAGKEFHPRVFLAHVRELYEALVTHKMKRGDFTMEQEAFFQLLEKRTVVDSTSGAVMFKLFTEFTLAAGDAVPDSMYVEYAAAKHLYINSLDDTDMLVGE
ncbi:hypothetical protein DFH06DRAFT_1365836 [Mycena polygramma]|nr:hypothetical protein DFH06DRAFT_1365836 [Mycena polygramma]